MGIWFSRSSRPHVWRSATPTAAAAATATATATATADLAATQKTPRHAQNAPVMPGQAAIMPSPALEAVDLLLPSEDAPVTPRQADTWPAADIGFFTRFPPEVRLVIYDWVFVEANPMVDISVEYERDGLRVLRSQMTYHGGELLQTSRGIRAEAFDRYWPNVTTVSASRSVSAPTPPAQAPADSKLPARSLPMDLGILVQVLPSLAIANTRHLRNVTFPEMRDRATNEVVAMSEAASLLAKFEKLETVEFKEYEDVQKRSSSASQWSLRSRELLMKLDEHAPFTMYPSMNTPQQWLKDMYGIDVAQDASFRRIHFLKKAVEKRRLPHFWAPVPNVQERDGSISPLPLARPLAAAFLDFTSGQSYARLPNLPDEEGYELVASWVEPSEPAEAETPEGQGFPEWSSPPSMISDF